MTRTVLIIGATRGLGASLASHYAQSSTPTQVIATSRGKPPADNVSQDHTTWVGDVDLVKPSCVENLVNGLKAASVSKVDIVILVAGYFATEDFPDLDWDKEVTMYITSSVAPAHLVAGLAKADLLKEHGGKILLVTSESGSIGLRHSVEGGNNYGHHASKAAENMVGKLLSMDLKEKGVAVGLVHPGFMRTEMTKLIGFDKFWDDGGAVTPDEAAASLGDWIDAKFDLSLTGTYWAPRGPKDIGTAEKTIGKDLPTPLQLPW